MDYTLLIHKSLTGQLSPQEKSLLDQWRSEPDNQKEYDHIKSLWQLSETPFYGHGNPTTTQHISLLKSRLRDIEKFNSDKNKLKKRMAAGYIIILLITLCFWYYHHQSQYAPNTMFVYQTLPASTNRILLPDSSIAYLSVNTKLNYQQQKQAPILTLVGKAFFEVTPTNTPFIVKAGNVSINAPGTTFTVKAPPNGAIEVLLQKGLIQASRNDISIQLTHPQDMVIFSDSIEHKTNASPNYLSWKSQRLTFNNTPLAQVISDLETHFNTSIAVSDTNMYKCTFTGDFHEADSITPILQVITASTNSTYISSGKGYLIQGKGCS